MEHPNPRKATVTITLTKAEAKHIAHLIRNRIRKAERQRDPDFVPAPGHHHTADRAIESGLKLLEKFEDALDTDIQVWEDEVYDDDPITGTSQSSAS